MPLKTRVLVDISELTKNSAGMLAKFYTSSKDIKVNEPYDLKFYENPLEVAEDATQKDDNYWVEHRHDTLTATEKSVYVMIDSLRSVPVVKSYLEIADLVINGYKRVGKIDIGPFSTIVANNNIEGYRFRIGAKTNYEFSRKWILAAFGAYGLDDRKFKYNARVNYIVSRKPWSIIGAEKSLDIDMVGLLSDNVIDNYLYLASAKWGNLERRRPFMHHDYKVFAQSEVRKGITEKITFRHHTFDPLFLFQYYSNPNDTESKIKTDFNSTEITLESRFAYNEMHIQADNERISLGTLKWPIFTLKYTLGLKGIFESDFNFQKVSLVVDDNIKVGVLGRSSYKFTAGYVPSRVPYPLLNQHLGNQSPFYSSEAYNLMNWFEFVTDTYASLQYTHRFEGLFFNRVPLIKKLKWRFLATTNILYGSVRDENRNTAPLQDVNGIDIPSFHSFTDLPYVEVGYGIENIFKFVRVDFIHRLTYLDKPNVRKFGVQVSTQFRL